MMRARLLWPVGVAVLAALLAALLAAGCGTGAPADGAVAASGAPAATAGDPAAFDAPPAHDAEPPPLQPSEPFDLAVLTLSGAAEQVRVPVYVAFDTATRRRGLMGRESLPAGTGMVFVFPDDRRGGFWMKDTLIPLSIAFYDASGEVLAVLDMEPCEADPCPLYDPGVTYRGALEVNQGYFDQIGLEEGWTVTLPEGLPAPR